MSLDLPLYLRLGPVLIHPHWLFETLAYLAGARLYAVLKRRSGDPLSVDERWWVVAAAFVGAAVGSKIVYWLSKPALMLEHALDPQFLVGGKSIVGGLVGAIAAVEYAKRRLGITTPTGDLFVVPMAVGIGIGRIGCFLSGLLPPEVLINGGRNTVLYEQDAVLRDAVFTLFATNHSPQTQAGSLRDLLCCLPQVAVPAGLSYENVFRVLIVQFIDAYSFDVRSVKKTCVHIVHPDGRLILFDTYNLFYRDHLEEEVLAPLRRREEAASAAP